MSNHEPVILNADDASLARVKDLAETWDKAHQEQIDKHGPCAYDPSCAEGGVHPNPFRESMARRLALASTGVQETGRG